MRRCPVVGFAGVQTESGDCPEARSPTGSKRVPPTGLAGPDAQLPSQLAGLVPTHLKAEAC